MPVSLADVVSKLMCVSDVAPRYTRIIPGISIVRYNNCNAIRGEETQPLCTYHTDHASLCKWIRNRDGLINDFRSVMTGERGHVLMTQSLLGVGLNEQWYSSGTTGRCSTMACAGIY